MPTPGQAPKSASSRRFNNPLNRWLEERKNKQKYLEEEAVRKISNKIEDNALTLIDGLCSVDFIHSQLPESVLNDFVPGFPFSKLEYDTKCLVMLLKNDRQQINLDIRPIDEKLMTLVLMFKQFVAHGDATAAQMALDALTIGIQDIRCKLPIHQPQLAEAFVEANTGYLDNWINLVGLAQTYDRLRYCYDMEQSAVLDAEQKKEAKTEQFAGRIENEPAFAMACFYILDHNSAADRAAWSEIHWEVFTLLVDVKREDFNIRLHRLQSISFENNLSVIKQQMESLKTYLNKLPNVSHPDLMYQYREAMEKFVKGIAESDQRTEETTNLVDQLSGALDLLDSTAGDVIQNEAAQANAHKLLELFRKKEAEETGENAFAHFRNLKEHGWMTKEERERQKAENEARLAEEQAKIAAWKDPEHNQP